MGPDYNSSWRLASNVISSKSPPLNSLAALEDYRWLLGDEGRQWLTESSLQPADLVRQAAALRKHLSPARCHLVLEQAELRRRAKQKFSAADRMFFTPKGLEQATDEWIAAYKAARFPTSGPLVDFCCGIGGDLLAMADRGPTIGIDRNPVAALFAEANLATQRETQRRITSRATINDVDSTLLKGVAAWHIDPDRRPRGRRTTRVELHEPGMPTIELLLSACSSGVIKLSPAAHLPSGWESDAELEWISRAGECRQLVAWFGALGREPGQHRASVLSAECAAPSAEQSEQEPRPDGVRWRVRSIIGQSSPPAVAGKLRRYLAEPDAAVLAADLSGVLAAERKLEAIAAGSAYLTGDQLAPDPALAWFEVAEVLPFDLRRLKTLLRKRGCGRLEVKKRAVPHDPEQVRRQLIVPGDNEATLFITRLGDAIMAILARRIEP